MEWSLLNNRPTTQELITFLEIELIEIPELLKQGLPAYFGDLGLRVISCDDMNTDDLDASFNRYGGLENYPIFFSIPVGNWQERTQWLDEYKSFWFKKEEVIEFLGAQKERPHSGQHEEHPGGSSSTKQNTEHLLQNMFRNLVESEKEYFENYDDVLSHPKIKKILADQNFNSRDRAIKYLRPVAQEIHRHLCKGGRPKKH